MSKIRPIICGSIAIDRIMNFSGNYRELINDSKLEVLSLSVLVDSLEISEGGISANICFYLAALGEEPVLLGSVGEDGSEYLGRLSELGIDVSGVHKSQLPTASFNVLTDTTGNQVGGFYPGAMGDTEGLNFSSWLDKDFEILACISAHDPAAMKRQTEECAEHHIRLVYDPGQQVSTIAVEDLELGINSAEVVIVNEYEHSLLLSRIGISEEELVSRVPVLVVTLGERGSYITGSKVNDRLSVAKAAPDKIEDPTGAGDAYRAGFLYGYLRQWDLVKCGQLGSVVASFALENHGPQKKISREEVLMRYERSFNERIEL